jgi:formylglycine-generating enzyme required for sulfatase activity
MLKQTISLLLFGVVAASCVAEDTSMVKIPAGRFLMGTERLAKSIKQVRPVHEVFVDAFYMDKYEVTQGFYQRMMGENPNATRRKSKREESRTLDSVSIGDTFPVTRVTWYDAVRFCNARSLQEGLKPCYDEKTWVCDFSQNGYRLPTDAEWEYACRAGATTRYYYGDDASILGDYANYWPDAEACHEAMADTGVWNKPFPKLIPVGQKKPNNWVLYDMLGNVKEWCNDWYSRDYYQKSSTQNPRGPVLGKSKVSRGGCYRDQDVVCAFRSGGDPNNAYATRGFRCVRSIVSKEEGG